jgi:Tfp pilus assembly protein PilF
MPIETISEYQTLLASVDQSQQALDACTNDDYIPQLQRLHAWNLANVGDCLYEQGLHSDALAYYIRAKKIDCDEPSVLNQIGVCLLELGKIDRAAYYFDLLHRRAPSMSYKAVALFNSAICHKCSGNLNEAIIALRKSLRCEADDSTTLELEKLKELNSRQAYRTFKHHIFSKNVLPQAEINAVPQRNNSKEFGA